MDNDRFVSVEAEKELLERICSTYGLDENLAARVLEDIFITYNTTIEEWIRSRHIQLQKRGLKNNQIYPILSEELKTRLFTAEPLSLRQIRRLIYG